MNSSEGGMKDGVFSGQAQGFAGTVIVDVTISGGKIADIKVRPHEETPFIADPAIETLTQNILAAQSTEVEVVSGATYTSEAIIKAVEQAVKQASVSYKDGVYTGVADGYKGPVEVEVTVSQGSITKVVVTDQMETPFIAKNAIDKIPEAIIMAQSWEVDGVSGATMTSNAIKAAVEKALTE
jgi:fumarate reductase flavoprotein subunit